MDFNNITINLCDIIILLIILASIFIGYSRGLAKEALALLGWIISGWATIKYYSVISILIRNYISPQIIADAIAFGILFLAIIIMTTIITHIISKNIQNSLLSPIDKIFGIIFSICRAILIISVISIFANQTIWKEKSIPSWFKDSYSYPFINKINKIIIKFIPNEIFSFNKDSLNLNKILIEEKLFSNIPTDDLTKPEGSYTPSETEEMNKLNNSESIETNDSN